MILQTGDVVGFHVPHKTVSGVVMQRTVWGRISIMWGQRPGVVVPLTIQLLHEDAQMWCDWSSIHTVIKGKRS